MWTILKNIRFFKWIFFHQFSILADKILIVLLDYILQLEALQTKCGEQVGILLPFLKWGRVLFRISVAYYRSPWADDNQELLHKMKNGWYFMW